MEVRITYGHLNRATRTQNSNVITTIINHFRRGRGRGRRRRAADSGLTSIKLKNKSIPTAVIDGVRSLNNISRISSKTAARRRSSVTVNVFGCKYKYLYSAGVFAEPSVR